MASKAWPSDTHTTQLKPIADVALALLARREHSVAELTRKLRQKGYEAADVRQTVADMQARGYVDDARYAVARARSRVLHSKWGWNRVAQELAGAGVEADLITAAHQMLADEGISLVQGATVLAKRKLKHGLDKDQAYKQRQKALAMLVRKGFSLTEAKQALDEAESGA